MLARLAGGDHGRDGHIAPGRRPHVQRELTIQHRSAVLRDAVALMEAEYASPLDLDEVAHRVATSSRQLQRCFAELGDGSFRECLAKIRMQRAAELLVGTSLPVRRVAELVGYRQPAQFAKAFRRHQGTPPATYRREHRGPQSVEDVQRAADEEGDRVREIHGAPPVPGDFFAIAI